MSMDVAPESHLSTYRTACFAAAGTFILEMVFVSILQPPLGFAGPPSAATLVVALSFIAFHFAMLLVVDGVPAPSWAQASGFVWVIADNAIGLMSLYGKGAEFVVALRMGLHLATATWIFGASLRRTDATRWIGVLGAAAFMA